MACDDITLEWGYSGPGGPDHWGALSSEYRACAEGVEQSPVDIAGYGPGDAAPIAFSYGGAATAVRNTGHTVYLDFPPGNVISVGPRQYQLLGVHYHSPGEHLLDGESFAAELHLVHQDSDGNLAVVGLLFRAGAPSPLVQALLDAAPATGVNATLNAGPNAAGYAPGESGYYGYNGSLTTPPCTEGVRWIVMRAIGTVSPEQVASLQELSGGPNNRPTRPIGQRQIVIAAGAA